VLNPDSTLAIILGVSECPRAPNLQPLPQCKNSAKDFDGYLRSIGIKNIINRFNSSAAASDQIDEIEDWLAGRMASSSTPPTDLIVYYTGHGGFSRNDQSYFLAVHRTREGSEGATSIRYIDLASSIKRHANSLRKYLILDCCFAAAAVIKTQADLTQLVVDRVQDELPPSGTAVLCSSAAKLVSIAPPGEKYTMFSGALLKCLESGVPDAPAGLTLEDIGLGARKIIQEKYPNEAVRPELHVPEQSHGNPARMPLFPNAWKTPAGPVEDKAAPRAPILTSVVPEHWLRTALRSTNTRTVIGCLCGLASAVTCSFTHTPWGLKDVLHDLSPWGQAPLAPGLCLSVAIIFVISALSRVRQAAIIMISLATLLAWQIAWMIFYYSLRFPIQHLQMTAAFAGVMFAGFVGAFLLTLSLVAALQGAHVVRSREELRFAARTSLPFGLWCGIAFLPTLIGLAPLPSLTNTLGFFVPWQGWYISNLPTIISREKDISLTTRIGLFAGSLALLCLLAVNSIRIWINSLGSVVTPIALQINAVSTAAAPPNQNVNINNEVMNNTPFNLTCTLQLHSKEATYTEDEQDTSIPIGSHVSRTSTFNLPAQDLSDANVRLSCEGGSLTYTTQWQDMKPGGN